MTATQPRPFPFDRSNLTGLIPFVWSQFKRRWVLIVFSAHLMVALSLGIALAGPMLSMLFSVPFVSLNAEPGTSAMVASLVGYAIGSLMSLTVSALFLMGFTRIVWGVLHDGPADLGMLFSQFPKAGKAFGLVLLLLLVGGVPLLLALGVAFKGLLEGPMSKGDLTVLLTGGLALSACLLLPLSFAVFELALNDQAGPWQSLRTAWELWSGRRLAIFKYGAVSAVVLVGGLILCVVPVIAAFAGVQLLFVGLYAALRQGGPASVGDTAIGPLPEV